MDIGFLMDLLITQANMRARVNKPQKLKVRKATQADFDAL